MNKIRIEVYSLSGNWQLITTIPSEPAYGIRQALKQAVSSSSARLTGGPRARAVDARGMIVDMEM